MDDLERHAREHFGKPLSDLRPHEREVAERSVRLTRDREHSAAERAAERAARQAQFEEAMRERVALISAMVTFLLARADDDPDRLEGEFTRKFVSEIVPKVEAMADAIENEGLRADVVGGEQLLRFRAAVYVDHPGYRPEWAPEP